MESKLKISVGNTTLKVAGSEKFVRDTYDGFTKKYLNEGSLQSAINTSNKQPPSADVALATYESKLEITPKSSGKILFLIAGCWLTIEQNKEKFSQAELLKIAKDGATYTQSKHGNNAHRLVKSLVKSGDFLKRNSTQYSVATKFLQTTRSKITN